MANDPVQKKEAEFNLAQKAFENAKKDYLTVVQNLKAFEETSLLKSAPFIMRAAYSDRIAWIMAVMAKLAYIEFETSDEELARLKFNLKSGEFELLKTFSQGSTQAFLAKNKFYAVLAFRGTEPKKIADVMADIRVYKTATKAGRVHAGFHDAYNAVAQEIEESLTDKNGDKWPLYITGHSLGGALATIATQDLEPKIGDQIAACYTFGGPKVGNRKFERQIKSPFYRIIHSTDIVTLVPNIGYVHVGDERFLSYRGEVYRGIPLQRLWEMLLAIINPLRWSRWVACHSMSEYERKLEAFALKQNPQIK